MRPAHASWDFLGPVIACTLRDVCIPARRLDHRAAGGSSCCPKRVTEDKLPACLKRWDKIWAPQPTAFDPDWPGASEDRHEPARRPDLVAIEHSRSLMRVLASTASTSSDPASPHAYARRRALCDARSQAAAVGITTCGWQRASSAILRHLARDDEQTDGQHNVLTADLGDGFRRARQDVCCRMGLPVRVGEFCRGFVSWSMLPQLKEGARGAVALAASSEPNESSRRGLDASSRRLSCWRPDR
jgi:hypothetical protein